MNQLNYKCNKISKQHCFERSFRWHTLTSSYDIEVFIEENLQYTGSTFHFTSNVKCGQKCLKEPNISLEILEDGIWFVMVKLHPSVIKFKTHITSSFLLVPIFGSTGHMPPLRIEGLELYFQQERSSCWELHTRTAEKVYPNSLCRNSVKFQL